MRGLARSGLGWFSTMLFAACSCWIGCGCGGGDGPSPAADAGSDGGDIEVPSPEAPRFTPCPDGWRSVEDPDRPGLVTCDPWPEGGPRSCAGGEVHWPGGAGCEPIGTPCTDDFAPDLPDGVPIVYARAGAGVGGDGTRARPFGTIAEAIRAATADGIVALGRGTFEEQVLTIGRTLWGACVAETIIWSDSAPGATISMGLASTLRNLQVRGAGRGIDVRGGGNVIESVLVQRAGRSGLDVQMVGDGRTDVLTARDLVVRECASTDFFGFGGLQAWNGRVSLERAVFERNHDSAIVVTLSDVEPLDLVLRDVVARDNEGLNDDYGGAGVALYKPEWSQAPVSFDFERVVLEGNQTGGMIVTGSEDVAEIVASDLVVRDTRPSPGEGLRGFGIAIRGASATFDRALVERNHSVGMTVEATGQVIAWDVVVRDTLSRESDGDGGDGIEALGGGELRLHRAWVGGNRRAGIVVAQRGTVGVMDDTVIEGTLAASCVDDWCAGAGGGCGVVTRGGAAATLSLFHSRDNAMCGVQVHVDGELDLHEGLVQGNQIGANVQVERYDIGRLEDRVLYRDNERTLDTSALPVPEPLGSIE